MQKQLVLAALFATAQAADCVDANTTMAKAALTANNNASAGLAAAKVAADAAAKVSKDAWDKAVKDQGTWTTAMSGFVAEQLKATNDYNAQKKIMEAAKAAMDALKNSGADAPSVAANKLLPLYLAETAKTTAAGLVSNQAAGSLWKADQDAGATQTILTTNATEHDDLKKAAKKAQNVSLDTWVTVDNAANGKGQTTAVVRDAAGAVTTAAVFSSTTETADETAKFATGKLWIRKVDASATGAAEEMRKCSAQGIGNGNSNAGAVWNLGSHNQAAGTAVAQNSAKEYKDQYLDCTSPASAANKGYTVVVTANKLLSAGTGATYVAWKNAQEKLENRAYLFGKLRHVCQNSTKYVDGQTLTPCARADQFERTYKNNYIGIQGTEDALFAEATEVAQLGLKIGDFNADSTFTKANANSVVEYVAATKKTKAGTAATSLFLDRDTKYDTWRAVVATTASKIVTENKAKVNYRQLVLLGTAYIGNLLTLTNNKHATLAAVGTQARLVQLATNKKQDAVTALGVGQDNLVATPAAAARLSKSALETLAAKFNKENAAFTTAKSTAALAAATGLTKDFFTASIAYHNANTKNVAAAADKARADTAKNLTAAAYKNAKTDETIKTYLFNIQDKKYKDAKATYDVAKALHDRMDAAKTLSEANASGGASAKTHNNDLSTKSYAAVTAQALAGKQAADAAATLAAGAVTTNTGNKTSMALVITAAENNCKANGYALAQATLKDIVIKNKAAVATADTVKAAYLVKANAARPASTDAASVEGSSCAFGPVTDGTPKPRPVCAETLCCGAANKFLRDGTKLTVETCQKTTAISYTFYPNIKAGATVAPQTEQWRFSCISGAKNLAATATAALAAAYLMA